MNKKYGIKYTNNLGNVIIAEFDTIYDKKHYIKYYEIKDTDIISEWGE